MISTNRSTRIDLNVPNIREFETFLYHEARLLDERRFDEWMGLFSEDGYYWVPTQWDAVDPLSAVSLFYDDREIMETRIRRLQHPKIYSDEPQARTRHIISNISLLENKEELGAYLVSSSFLMIEYREDVQRLFGGEYRHLLRQKKDGSFEIAWKRVNLVNCDAYFSAMSVPI